MMNLIFDFDLPCCWKTVPVRLRSALCPFFWRHLPVVRWWDIIRFVQLKISIFSQQKY